VQPPDREHVRGVPAADHDHVRSGDERSDVVHRALEELEVRRLAVEARELLIALGATRLRALLGVLASPTPQ